MSITCPIEAADAREDPPNFITIIDFFSFDVDGAKRKSENRNESWLT
jgi:hypothetical protein